MAYTASDRDLPAHQARQQQVAGGAESCILEPKNVSLRKKWLRVLVECPKKRGSRNEDLVPPKIACDDRRIGGTAGMVLQVPDEGVCRHGVKQKSRRYRHWCYDCEAG